MPSTVMEKANEAEDQRITLIKSLKAKIKAAELQRQSWLNALSDPLAENSPDWYFISCQNELNKSEVQLKNLHGQLRELMKGKQFTKGNVEKTNGYLTNKYNKGNPNERLSC